MKLETITVEEIQEARDRFAEKNSNEIQWIPPRYSVEDLKEDNTKSFTAGFDKGIDIGLEIGMAQVYEYQVDDSSALEATERARKLMRVKE